MAVSWLSPSWWLGWGLHGLQPLFPKHLNLCGLRATVTRGFSCVGVAQLVELEEGTPLVSGERWLLHLLALVRVQPPTTYTHGDCRKVGAKFAVQTLKGWGSIPQQSPAVLGKANIGEPSRKSCDTVSPLGRLKVKPRDSSERRHQFSDVAQPVRASGS